MLARDTPAYEDTEKHYYGSEGIGLGNHIRYVWIGSATARRHCLSPYDIVSHIDNSIIVAVRARSVADGRAELGAPK
jgi:hypothetical protein